jgi:hypothetical protein
MFERLATSDSVRKLLTCAKGIEESARTPLGRML